MRVRNDDGEEKRRWKKSRATIEEKLYQRVKSVHELIERECCIHHERKEGEGERKSKREREHNREREREHENIEERSERKENCLCSSSWMRKKREERESKERMKDRTGMEIKRPSNS